MRYKAQDTRDFIWTPALIRRKLEEAGLRRHGECLVFVGSTTIALRTSEAAWSRTGRHTGAIQPARAAWLEANGDFLSTENEAGHLGPDDVVVHRSSCNFASGGSHGTNTCCAHDHIYKGTKEDWKREQAERAARWKREALKETA
jgi:alkanesulfonate monooxygenase SsuD/methylene tetrahydromethanopterin reductase-like flavin-dependent oxidoreductase (luciferase family)